MFGGLCIRCTCLPMGTQVEARDRHNDVLFKCLFTWIFETGPLVEPVTSLLVGQGACCLCPSSPNPYPSAGVTKVQELNWEILMPLQQKFNPQNHLAINYFFKTWFVLTSQYPISYDFLYFVLTSQHPISCDFLYFDCCLLYCF